MGAPALTRRHVVADAPAALRREQGFSELVTPLLPALMRVARRRSSSPDLARDAVQEALLALWQAPVPPPEPLPWLLQAVIYRCLHQGRTHRRQRRYEEQAGQAWADAMRAFDPADHFEVLDRTRRLRTALAALPPEQRTVLHLRESEGLDYQAIASRLRIPVGTVRSRISRARSALRANLEGLLATPDSCLPAQARSRSCAVHRGDHTVPATHRGGEGCRPRAVAADPRPARRECASLAHRGSRARH